MAVPVPGLHGPPCRPNRGRRGVVDLARQPRSALYLGPGAGAPAAWSPVGGRKLRVALDRVDADHQAVGGVTAARQPVELLDEVADARPELVGPVVVEPRVPDEGPQPPLLLGPGRLRRSHREVVLVGGQVLLTLDGDGHRACGPSVEPLLDGTHPSGAHHLHEPGPVQHTDVVRDGPLGTTGGLRQLGDRGGSVR